MSSEKLKLNKEDGAKILKGAGIAVAGALLVYVVEILPNVDFNAYTPIVVALAGVLVNSARKWLASQ